MLDILNESSHRRFNPLTGEWIQVSPHRAKRPWQGKVEKNVVDDRPSYDPKCYLCPGNTRANGEKNPDYVHSFIFQNDFAALQENIDEVVLDGEIIKAKSEKGICKVICFSPKHNLTLPEMSVSEIEKVIRLWKSEFIALSQHSFIHHIQIFENKGEIMGCSNPHPHGQIWAQESLPVEAAKKDKNQKAYFQQKGNSLLKDYIDEELKRNERILFENEHMVVLVPFWAVWPYECMIAPKKHAPDISELSEDEMKSFAEALQWLTIRYDNLFETSFPYSAGIHQGPVNTPDVRHWHWHMSFYPPLLRSATVKKFMVGYEMFANPQRDITAEQAVEKLKALSSKHYKKPEFIE